MPKRDHGRLGDHTARGMTVTGAVVTRVRNTRPRHDRGQLCRCGGRRSVTTAAWATAPPGLRRGRVCHPPPGQRAPQPPTTCVHPTAMATAHHHGDSPVGRGSVLAPGGPRAGHPFVPVNRSGASGCVFCGVWWWVFMWQQPSSVLVLLMTRLCGLWDRRLGCPLLGLMAILPAFLHSLLSSCGELSAAGTGACHGDGGR